ncbi:hypothetical protein HanIR_Chr17g0876211 [Helianthus annuus]|nr:hypothetical protein HanIR_Chr17g0876211 [Helianthus annuus]
MNKKSCSVGVHKQFMSTYISLTNEHKQDIVCVRSVHLQLYMYPFRLFFGPI